jgi:hypothetical protein
MASQVLYMGITTCSADPRNRPEKPPELLDSSAASSRVVSNSAAGFDGRANPQPVDASTHGIGHN